MEDLSERISALSMCDLRDELNKFGDFVNVPNVPSARRILEKKLLQRWTEKSEDSGDDCNTEHAHSPLATQGINLINGSSSTSGELRNSNTTDKKSTCGDSPTTECLPPPAEINCLESPPSSLVVGNMVTPEECSIFYGVCFPDDYNADDQVDGVTVFTNKTEALKLAKKVKGSRFKAFKSRSDAEQFAVQSPMPTPKNNTPESDCDKSDLKPLPKAQAGESLPFSSVKTQDYIKLRRAIETNNVEKFKELVQSNPRYLISSGDTPTILQEGFRYNGMHSAAMKNQPGMARLLLDTIEDPSFLQSLYVNDDPVTRDKRIRFLVDLYLNTPDKGFNETPLHFASKFGNLEVIKVLCAHPMTNVQAVNKEGNTAAQIVCSRVTSPTAGLKEAILHELEGQFYVPLWRSEDNTTQPVIGDPWSPTGEREMSSNVPVTSPLQLVSPRSLTSPLSPRPSEPTMSVKAYAGPMSPSQAADFYKNWSTPPKGSSLSARKSFHVIKRQDSDKGLERIGRDLARKANAIWTEFWPFLGCTIDISSQSGLEKLEKYLQSKHAEFKDNVDSGPVPNKTPENNMAAGDAVLKTPDSVDKQLDDVIGRFSALQLHSPGSPASPVHPSSDKSREHSKSNEQSAATSSKNDSAVSAPSYSSLEYIVPALSPALRRVRGVLTHLWRRKPAMENVQGEVIPVCRENGADDETDFVLKTPERRSSPKLLRVFLNGGEPTKTDVDILRALEGAEIPQTLVHVIQWKQLVETSTAEERQSWPTPCRTRPREITLLKRSKLTLDNVPKVQTNLMAEFLSAESS